MFYNANLQAMNEQDLVDIGCGGQTSSIIWLPKSWKICLPILLLEG
jgi:hypothetical protein